MKKQKTEDWWSRDLFQLIFSALPPIEWPRCAAVCRMWREEVNRLWPLVWEPRYKQIWAPLVSDFSYATFVVWVRDTRGEVCEWPILTKEVFGYKYITFHSSITVVYVGISGKDIYIQVDHSNGNMYMVTLLCSYVALSISRLIPPYIRRETEFMTHDYTFEMISFYQSLYYAQEPRRRNPEQGIFF